MSPLQSCNYNILHFVEVTMFLCSGNTKFMTIDCSYEAKKHVKRNVQLWSAHLIGFSR